MDTKSKATKSDKAAVAVLQQVNKRLDRTVKLAEKALKAKATRRVAKPARDLTITELAERMAALARIMDSEVKLEVHDAAAAEQGHLEEMILLRRAANFHEAAVQLALVSSELNEGDWSQTEDVNTAMRKYGRVVVSAFAVIANEVNFRPDDLGGYVS